MSSIASHIIGAATMPHAEINITSAAFHANPFDFYRRLRDEAPVCTVTLQGKLTAYLVTRYDDVNALLRDARFVKRPGNVPLGLGERAPKEPWMPGFLKPLETNMLDLDGADHARLRGLVHQAFTPKLIERMRALIESTATRLIDAALRAGTFDLVREIALPLPVTIIADMLGVPENARGKFAAWSQRITSNTGGSLEMLLALPDMWRFMRYVRGLVALRRAQPGDDLISALIMARDTGQALSEDEIVAMIVLLLIAGHETTVSLISSGMLGLLTQPDACGELRAEPELIKSGVEELLRFASPVALATQRYAAEDAVIAGVVIPKGALTFGALLAANHDERRFERPERIDVRRADNRHLALGQGVHYCLGAPLARMEATIGIGALLARLPNLRLAVAPERLRWRRSQNIRALVALPVRV